MLHKHLAQHPTQILPVLQSLEETERLVQLGMAPADAAGGLRLGGGHDGFEAHLDGILDEVCAADNALLALNAPSPHSASRSC